MYLGTESTNHAFRHIALSLALREDQSAYEFTLNKVKDFLQNKFNYNYQPKFSMSHNHAGGLGALISVFPSIVRLRCKFHLDQSLERKLRGLGLKSHLTYIRWTVKMLSECKTQKDFDKLWILLEPEIKNLTGSDPFVKYFKEEIIDSNALWYCGASFVGKQKCNNSLEAMNRYLKSNWTKDEPKSVIEFFIVMEKAFDYYVRKCQEEKCMPVDCVMLREFYRKASLIISKKRIFKFDPTTFVFLRIPKRFKTSAPVREQETLERLTKVNQVITFIKENVDNRFENLSNFLKIDYFFSFYDVTKKKCSCKTFWNRGICKHLLASEISLGKIMDSYSQQIVEGSQVGRPKNLQL